MSLLDGLRALAAESGRRRALALVLAGLAVLAALAAAGALAARLGLFAHLRWAPLVFWIGVLAGAWVVGRGAWVLLRNPRALREAAADVEEEQALRRGAFVGFVDLATVPAAGTSAELVESAGRRLAGDLPTATSSWTPKSHARLSATLRRRAVFAASGLLLAVVSFVFAGDAAATLVSPLRALRVALRPRVAIAVSKSVIHAGENVTVTVETEAGGGRCDALRAQHRGSLALGATRGRRRRPARRTASATSAPRPSSTPRPTAAPPTPWACGCSRRWCWATCG